MGFAALDGYYTAVRKDDRTRHLDLPSPPNHSSDVDRSELTSLTPREREIAALVARGLSNAQIAKRLGVTERTVKNRLTVVFHKLDVRSRVQLALRVRDKR
jgi:DNA-binding NarL/FixJ family response regulator